MTQEVSMFRSMLTLITIGLLLAVQTGCTTYDITKPDGTRVAIRSTRSFPNGISVDYQSAQGASLKIQAGSVSQPDATTAALNVVNTALGIVVGRLIPAVPPVATGAATTPPLMLRPPEALASGQ